MLLKELLGGTRKHTYKDLRAIAPSGDMLDFQMPKKPVAKTNKGLFIVKYEALCLSTST
jgi:hypothetical protein